MNGPYQQEIFLSSSERREFSYAFVAESSYESE